MPDQKALEWVENEQSIRVAFQNTFSAGDGPQVLTVIGNQCGAFATDPAEIRPELIALWHWILAQIGVIHKGNLVQVTEAMLTQANNSDLAAIRKAAEID